MDYQEFRDNALRIVEEGQKNGAKLRLLGAVAFSIHCPTYSYFQEKANRHFTDLDFAGLFRESAGIKKTFKNLGLAEDVQTNTMYARSRLIFENPKIGLHVDVFLDKLDFCHPIPWAGRLEADRPTIPLAEMVLEKMQIFQLNEKDVIDTLMLLREHPIGSGDAETVNADRITSMLAKDWGMWRTITMNLKKVADLAPNYDWLDAEGRKVVLGRIEELMAKIDAAPKTLGWTARSKVGDRVKWYKDVFEVQQ